MPSKPTTKPQPEPVRDRVVPVPVTLLSAADFASMRGLPWVVAVAEPGARRSLQQWDLWLQGLRSRTAQ